MHSILCCVLLQGCGLQTSQDTHIHTYIHTHIHAHENSLLSTFKWDRPESEIKRHTLRVTVKVWSVRAVLQGEEDT